MLTIAILKKLIPEINEYIRQGHNLVFEKDENEKSIVDIVKFTDTKRKLPYYSAQLNIQDRSGNDRYFIDAKVYSYSRKRDYKLAEGDEVIETVIEYEIEHNDNIKTVYEVIQTIDSDKCLVEREVQKTQLSKRTKKAYIAERLVDEERNLDGMVVERIMYPGRVLVSYSSLVGSEKWTRYQHNPIYVRNLRYIKIEEHKGLNSQFGEDE